MLLATLGTAAQRTYRPSSVLATGAWFRISAQAEGVYKIDVPLLNSLGITGSIPSAQFRLFGNGGGMLPEANAEIPLDDLQENAVMVEDGGDGVLNGSDYVLFYAQGPHHWVKDSLNKRFIHKKNLYAEKAFYYITIGGSGLRIPLASNAGGAAVTVSSFNERYFHELDTVNFLSSGKEWYGEEFSAAPGRSLSRLFTLPLQNLLPQSATLITQVAARSVNTPSRFNVSLNGQPVQQIDVSQISPVMYDLFAQQGQATANTTLFQPDAFVSISYVPGSFNSQGWLNWFEFFCRRSLTQAGDKQLLFRDWASVAPGNAEFLISTNQANAQVWDLTNPLRPVKMNTSFSAGQLRFVNESSRLREYVCFSTSLLTPKAEGRIANQNLHSTTEKDFLLVTPPAFLSQAQRLAQFHQQRNGLRTLVVTTEEIFHEFAGGTPDPTAIRDFVKMYYDRYAASWGQLGKYLLLMGKASFDYKDRLSANTNLVPAYESVNSLDPLATYTSDDFFGFLEDHEDINSALVVNGLDIGIGRIPAMSAEEAKNFVDKVLDYHASASLGPWRNNLNFIADDEDLNLHLQDAEIITATAATAAPAFNQQKIYLDAFRQENGSAGGRYPGVNAAVNNNIYNGTLLWNYSGHGGPQRLADEVVIDQQAVDGWSNKNRLPLFVTATCDFAPYDNPSANSLGENLLLRRSTGAIALMTTTRVVFAFSNRVLNNNYLKYALEPASNGRYRSLGQAVMEAKNFTYQTFSDIVNNRKFTLLGDPAMTLGFPVHKTRITRVNGKDITALTDTLSATELVLMEGEVTDNAGNLIPGFQGTAYLSLFDKAQTVTTLGNDPTSQPAGFQTQESSLFRGKASVLNGRFSFSFKVPRDINYQYGSGRVSLYAQNGTEDANGLNTSLIIGGIAAGSSSDNEGPQIRAYLNDERFVNGSITDDNPILILRLTDSSGINTGGSGVDHDIVATLDNDNDQYYILNNFYESDLDNYQKGMVRFQLPQLAPGPHSLRIKVWDVVNNSSEYLLEFTVINSEELRIDRVLNYPNPFTTSTSFWFEHNQPGTDLPIRVEIFTVSGKLIKTLAQTINTIGNRSNEVHWDGRDEYGNKVGRGVYLYRLRVRGANGKTAEKWERLVTLGK
ncbi:MAG TPA: type IX secretion system sortase PorU [Flavisolibacter sp.]|nr:type IX secretion system sortase PorU [Flavisolibacter sp.]